MSSSNRSPCAPSHGTGNDSSQAAGRRATTNCNGPPEVCQPRQPRTTIVHLRGIYETQYHWIKTNHLRPNPDKLQILTPTTTTIRLISLSCVFAVCPSSRSAGSEGWHLKTVPETPKTTQCIHTDMNHWSIIIILSIYGKLYIILNSEYCDYYNHNIDYNKYSS